jgi:hypothetical protein
MTHLNAMNIPPDIEDDIEDEEEMADDGLPHLNEDLTDDWQEDALDELGEYSDNTVDPEEVLYGEENTDFDYAYYDNEDEWEGIEGQDEV